MNINLLFLYLTSNAVTIVNNLVVIIPFSKNVNSELKPAKSPVGLCKSWMLEILLSLFSSQTVMWKQWKSKLEAKYEIKCYFSVIIAMWLVFGFSVSFSDFHFGLEAFFPEQSFPSLPVPVSLLFFMTQIR